MTCMYDNLAQCKFYKYHHIHRKVVQKGRISVTNNAFSLTPGHPLLVTAMTTLTRSYSPQCWGCIGPELMTDSVQRHTGAKFVQRIPQSANIKFVPLFR